MKNVDFDFSELNDFFFNKIVTVTRQLSTTILSQCNQP